MFFKLIKSFQFIASCMLMTVLLSWPVQATDQNKTDRVKSKGASKSIFDFSKARGECENFRNAMSPKTRYKHCTAKEGNKNLEVIIVIDPNGRPCCGTEICDCPSEMMEFFLGPASSGDQCFHSGSTMWTCPPDDNAMPEGDTPLCLHYSDTRNSCD